MRFSARLLGVLFTFLLVFFVTKTSFAQNNSNLPQNIQAQQYVKSNTNPDVPLNLHTWTQSVMIEVMSSMSCQLAGVDPTNPKGKCLGIDQKTGKIGYVQGNGGVPAFLGQMITYLYIPPVQTSEYIRYLSQNFGITKPTYAQVKGIGYTQLSPLLNLWAAFRNMVYLLFVILFVIVGVAIMLRVKIDPRTVMTIQNQIPRLIIGIIMVTFSFAIAGFMVDLMWVSTYTVVSVIGSADSAAKTSDFSSAPPVFVNNYLAGGDTWGGLHRVASDASDSVVSVIQNMFSPITHDVPVGPPPELGTDRCTGKIPVFCQIATGLNDIVGGAINAVVNAAGSIVNVFTGVFTGLLSMIIGFVAFLIIIIAIIYSLFKLWLALIKAYIMILIDVVFAPFWIIGGLLPGASSLGFTNWLRSLLGNLAAFPAVIALFAIGKVFVDSFGPNTPAGQMFIPPLIGNINPKGANIISSIIALGIILASPEVVSMTRKAFKGQGGGGGGGGFMGGAAIGAAIGAGRSFVANPARRVKNATFGTDPRTGNPRFGSAYIGRKFGAVAQVATGGGTAGRDSWLRNPGTFRGWGGKAAKGIEEKVITPVAGKVAASPIGQAAGAVAASPVGKAIGTITAPVRRASGRINASVPKVPSEPVVGHTQQPSSQPQRAEKELRGISKVEDAAKRLEQLAEEQKKKNG